MQEKNYALKTILASVFKEKNNKIKKRLIYNQAAFGGINNKWIMLAFIAMPFAMYGAIFNPAVFNELGIAQAIVFYIILLVVAMQIVAIVAYFNNKKVIQKAIKEWKAYFSDIDFKMIISTNNTPYIDFKKHYENALHDGLEGDDLHKRLKEAFHIMEEENSVLVEAMKRDQMKREGK